jgi:hypothetical protein
MKRFFLTNFLILACLCAIVAWNFHKAKLHYAEFQTVELLTKKDFEARFLHEHLNFYVYLGSDEKFDYAQNHRYAFWPYQLYFKIPRNELKLEFERFSLFEKEPSHLIYSVFDP